MKYPIVETFLSINGEGRRAGELAYFIRLKGCNLRCPYCDTKWAYLDDAECNYLSVEELCSAADGVVNVTITGGEPMQYDLSELTDALIENNHRVEIETNGSIPIYELSKRKLRPSFTLDYKLPSSLMEDKMDTDNYNYLNENDTVKFVVGDFADLERAREIIMQFDLSSRCGVFLSPVFGSITAAEIVDYLKDKKMNNVRVQLQLHKYIWDPELRGV